MPNPLKSILEEIVNPGTRLAWNVCHLSDNILSLKYHTRALVTGMTELLIVLIRIVRRYIILSSYTWCVK